MKFAGTLGYSAVCITTRNAHHLPRNGELYRQQNMQISRRIDLSPSTPTSLLSNLRRFRGMFDVIAVLCRSKSVARQAAKDHSVDILQFPLHLSRNPFDAAEAELASGSNAALEIDAVQLVRAQPITLPHNFTRIRQSIETAKQFDIPIVVSSGATSVYDLRSPRDLASLIQLLGLSEEQALNALSETPMAIIQRNRCKRNKSYVEAGVKIVKERSSHVSSGS